ncbi:hypothetical protein FB157_13618 [Streptomyces sp. BK340]|nr:hypothetical protein FB157_13618 [Streptomyces sp. BK340]
MHAREFFAELELPFADRAVVGDTYYATPIPGAPLRLRIDFSPTQWANEYAGLRLATLHQDRGELDDSEPVRPTSRSRPRVMRKPQMTKNTSTPT